MEQYMEEYIDLNAGLVVVRMKRELFYKMLSEAIKEVEGNKKKDRNKLTHQRKEKA